VSHEITFECSEALAALNKITDRCAWSGFTSQSDMLVSRCGVIGLTAWGMKQAYVLTALA